MIQGEVRAENEAQVTSLLWEFIRRMALRERVSRKRGVRILHVFGVCLGRLRDLEIPSLSLWFSSVLCLSLQLWRCKSCFINKRNQTQISGYFHPRVNLFLLSFCYFYRYLSFYLIKFSEDINKKFHFGTMDVLKFIRK